MIAVDTNILVYAHRSDVAWHQRAKELVTALAESGAKWAIPWPCVHEFLSVVTNARAYVPPTPLKIACERIERWMDSPSLVFLGETNMHWPTLNRIAASAHVAGGAIHDARIAAICLQHGVDELWTADRDFSRFPDLKTRNPLVAKTR